MIPIVPAAGWGANRPGSTGTPVGVQTDSSSDPYAHCEGWKLGKIGLSASQLSRVHRLLRKRGLHSTCTHDLGGGLLTSDLSRDGGLGAGHPYYDQRPVTLMLENGLRNG